MTATLRINIVRTIYLLAFLAIAACFITPTYAQDATSSTTRREKVQQKIDTRKENIENKIASMREKLASREAALKAKLDTFKDKRKAQIAERVNTNLNKINENQTTQMGKHLEKMSEILAKLETRVNSGSPDVKDPLAAKAAIASARASIATASAAVSAQAEKDYTITLTSESKVRTDAQAMRDSLKTDITAVKALVIEAKQAVGNAIRVAKSGSKLMEGTPSGQQ